MNWTKLIFVFYVLFLVGCSTTGDKSPLPQDGRKMIDIYRGATAEDFDEKPRPQEEVKNLCDQLNHEDVRKDCEHKANEMGLLVQREKLEGDVILTVKEEKPQPEPLYADYTRTPTNEIQVLFPRLPNPDIEIFIYPHLATKNQVPVPGYTTVIPLYDTVQYAMPGEMHRLQH